MRKTSIGWLIAGVILGAATVLITVGVRQSSAGLTASEAQTLAEVQHLLGDPTGPEGGLDLSPIPSLSPELARDLAAMEKQQRFALEPGKPPLPPAPINDTINRPHNHAEQAAAERIHAPLSSEPDEDYVSVPQPRPLATPLVALPGGSTPLPYTGNFSCVLEKLGKLHLPHGVCQQLRLSGVLFVTPGADGCIELYPQVALDRDPTGRKLNEDEARRQRRLWFSRMTAVSVALTETGACVLTLPHPFVQAADLDGYLVIIGVGDHFEIWDAQRWQDYVDGKEAPTAAQPVEPASWNGEPPF